MGKTFYYNCSKIKNMEDIIQASDVPTTLKYLGIDYSGSGLIQCPLPEHEDSTGSFGAYEKNGKSLWNCFGCNSGGDSISLLKKVKKISYNQAVLEVAELFGVEVEFVDNYSKEQYINQTKWDKFYEWFSDFLAGGDWRYSTKDKKSDALIYLDDRCIERSMISSFNIGFSTGEYVYSVLAKAKELGISVEELIEAKILKKYQTEYDEGVEEAIKDRLVFAVEYSGKIVGFNCRTIYDEVKPKYYKAFKGAGLWNSDTLYEGCEVILTEGVFDAITLIQLGFRAVALLGNSSLTDKDLELLKKCGRVYIFLDGDESGERASVEIATKIGQKAYIVDGIKLESAEIKDVNGWFVSLVNKKYKECNDKEQAFKDTIKEARKYIDKLLLQSENLVTKNFNEWNEIENESERIVAFEELLRIACRQYDNNEGLIDNLKKEVKKYGISAKYFDETKKIVKKQVAEEIKFQSKIENQLVLSQNGTSNFEEWEVIEGILYKNVPVFNGYIDYQQVEVTRTVPNIKSALTDSTGREELEVVFTDRFGVEKKVIASRDSFLTKNKIIETLGNYGYDISDANYKDNIEYIRFLQNTNSNEIEHKILVDTNGYYDGVYIGRKGEIITENGLSKDSKIVFKNQAMDNSIKEITNVEDEVWIQLIKEAFPNILRLNDKEAILAIMSWYLASICKEPIQNIRNKKEFPILGVFGTKGSGKSSIIKIMERLLGNDGDLKSAKITPFAMLSSISVSNAFPTVFDEYKAGDLTERDNANLMNKLKLAYNSGVDQKGRQDLSIRSFNLTSPISIVGESSFWGDAKDAVLERSVVVQLSRTWYDRNRSETSSIINKLNGLELENFLVGYLKYVLKLISSGRIKEMFEVAEQRVYNFDKEDIISDRPKLNIKVLGFGVEMIKELLNIAGADFEITDEEIEDMFKFALNHILNPDEVESAIDRIMLYFATISEYETTKDFTDSDILCDSSEKRLYVNRSKFLTILETHRYQHKADLPDKKSIERYLKENMEGEGYIIELNKVKKIKGKSIRCVVIDLVKLEKIAKVDRFTWINYHDSSIELSDDKIKDEIAEIMNSENYEDVVENKIIQWRNIK